MTKDRIGQVTLIPISWELRATIEINASVEQVYDLVSDITRMGEWSPECYGGAWVRGVPGEMGSRFHGYNQAGEFKWTTESEVVESSRPHDFSFSVLNARMGGPNDTSEWAPRYKSGEVTWEFHLRNTEQGCELTQAHTAHCISLPANMVEGLDVQQRAALLETRKRSIQDAMESTLSRIKEAFLSGVAGEGLNKN